MISFDSIVFDLDGTLVDSMPLHTAAWQKAFGDVGVEFKEEELYSREGEKGEDFAEWIAAKYAGAQKLDLKAVLASYVKTFSDLYSIRFFPEALPLLKRLHSAGLKLGLVSGSKNIRQIFSVHPEFLECFGVIVTGDDTPIGKPSPMPFLKAFELLGVEPSRSLVIENAPFGIRGAKAAGASCWAVRNNSPLSGESLIEVGAERVFDKLSSLEELLTA